MVLIVLAIYIFALSFILLFSLVQFNLVINYIKYHKKNKTNKNKALSINDKSLPFVTIQLPIYNEMYVVERLIDSVAKFNYPKHKFEIQVLDDSNDKTVSIITNKVKEIEGKGINIYHVQREKRIGFKAGALSEGMKKANGEFIAIFDADFIPSPDYILRSLSYFKNDRIGMVQSTWGHINKDYSFLTRIQAFALDAHFTIEQTGRYAGGHFINFNGTAGIWRKECIIDSGGWQHDTLTEDLDLSYRAQLKGWKFVFAEDLISPAELPVAMSAIKNQQFRWMKGGAENLVKFAGNLIKSNNIQLKSKIHGIAHLMGSSIFLFVFIISILSIPTLYIKNNSPHYAMMFVISSFFLISMLLLIVFYKVSFKKEHINSFVNWIKFITRFFIFLSLSMGMSFHNTIAVLEGYSGKKSAFIRTPKFNVKSKKDNWKNNVYLSNKINLITIIEGFLSLYFLYGIASAFYLHDFGLFPFHTLLFLGFGIVFINSVFQFRSISFKYSSNT